MDRLWLCQFVDEGFGFDGASGTTCSMNIVVAYLDLVDLIVQKKKKKQKKLGLFSLFSELSPVFSRIQMFYWSTIPKDWISVLIKLRPARRKPKATQAPEQVKHSVTDLVVH